MQRFMSNYGRKGIRVSDPCPTQAIQARLARVQIGTSVENVEAMVRDAIADLDVPLGRGPCG